LSTSSNSMILNGRHTLAKSRKRAPVSTDRKFGNLPGAVLPH
jgi:hypothetical protein